MVPIWNCFTFNSQTLPYWALERDNWCFAIHDSLLHCTLSVACKKKTISSTSLLPSSAPTYPGQLWAAAELSHQSIAMWSSFDGLRTPVEVDHRLGGPKFGHSFHQPTHTSLRMGTLGHPQQELRGPTLAPQNQFSDPITGQCGRRKLTLAGHCSRDCEQHYGHNPM